jgi:N-dimethylarginine dimethylaminohydrolase
MKAIDKVYTPDNFPFHFMEIENRPEPNKVLMVSPEYFDIVDVKNVHMQDNQGSVNHKLAQQQWQNLLNIYIKLQEQQLLSAIKIISGVEGCEDMVFAANQSFPWISREGKKQVIMSKMRHQSRKNEVSHFERSYFQEAYQIIKLKQTELFEGMGDAITLPGKRLIFGGYGHRSDYKALEEVSQILNVPIIALELVNEKFYHLDTCFIPLDAETCLLYPGAFQPQDLKGLKKLFKHVLEIPENEATNGFALNAHILQRNNNRAAIIQSGNPYTIGILEKYAYKVYQTDTSEYIKSGGSVFCMKMMWY